MSTSTAVRGVSVPRELVLASAGTGKTFRISTRIIGLLAAGSRADAIFASSFTRKAAGEILDRVLVRLANAALDPKAASELAGCAELAAGSLAGWTTQDWLRLLRQVISDLHRLNVGTLDAFFVRTATSFADELQLPPGWFIADEPTAQRVRDEALGAVLRDADAGEMLELVRAAEAKGAARSVHDALRKRAQTLLALEYALDPESADAWDGLAELTKEPAGNSEEQRIRLADALEVAQVPLNKDGTPKKSWIKALGDLSAVVRRGDWDKLVTLVLFRNSGQEDACFDRVPIPEPVLRDLDEVRRLARTVFARRLSSQGRALGGLAKSLAGAVAVKQREMGAFGFEDLTRLLSGPGPVCDRPDLFYRLDARIRHVLLDEFQDTSLAQWNALQPLLDGVLTANDGAGAAVVVADPKQSIYAWRGGEPRLVRHVGDRYTLASDELARSWRSSQIVLDLVNRVFGDLEANRIFEKSEPGRSAAADWMTAFVPHTAVQSLPGYVQILVGPADEGSGNDRPLLCRRAAQLVADLRTAAPGRSIGVLTRTNETVARIMLELRDLGIPASEEGGNPLTDSAAVSAVLALLRMADHPGDRVARYHVAHTPVGEVVKLPDHTDDGCARTVAHEVRAKLLEMGYGRALHEITRGLMDFCEPRDRRRLDQLVEMGFRYDARATLRTTDFIRLVEAERVEDPTSAEVRVMTVHQSKGLEFDMVVLPELDNTLVRSDGEPLAYRSHPASPITRVFPYVSEDVRALFPDVKELQDAADEAAAGRWRDALSGLYVALTRARHAVYLLVKPDGKDARGKDRVSTARTAARLVRCALEVDGPAQEGQVLFERGDPRWYESVETTAARVAAAGQRSSGPGAAQSIRLRPSSHLGKLPGKITPSSLAGGSRVDLSLLLRLDRSAAELGTLAHAWFEQIGWLEDGIPSDEELRRIARSAAPAMSDEDAEALRIRFRSWLATPDIRYLLSRNGYPSGATVDREVPFLFRAEGCLVEGFIDRLVLVREGGRVVSAEILDYKTDAIRDGDAASLADRAAHYRPQLNAYRAAVAGWYGFDPVKIPARLIFLAAPAVVEV